MVNSPKPENSSRTTRSPSRQRDHPANERTFLAWLRTSIARIGFGFAIARFGLFLRQFEADQAPLKDPFINSQDLGIGLVIFGIAIIVLAAWRYSQVFSQIEQGDFRPSRRAIWILTAIVTCLGVMSLPLLIGRAPTQRQQMPESQAKSR